jgi:HD-like signal output (HDOD) protein
MNTIISGSNPKTVNFYSAYMDMLGVANESYNSVNIGLKRAIVNPSVINIVLIIENRDDFLIYSKNKINIDTYTKNLLIICVDEKLKQSLSGPKIIVFNHKEITMGFATTLTKLKICKPYLQGANTEKTPEKIFEHIKFMLAKGNITLPIENECALNVLSALEQDNITFKAIDDMTKVDPALHSGIIKMANSAYYSGAFSEIKDVQKALVRVGLSNVKAFLINFINKSIASNKELLFAEEISESVSKSLKIASLCYVMADFFRVCSTTAMFSTGMLSKLGEIFMYAIISDYISGEDFEGHKPEGYKAMVDRNSLMVGGMLLKKWKFPEDYYIPVLSSNSLNENSYMNETRILFLACHMVNYFDTGEAGKEITDALKLTNIQLSDKQLNRIRTEAQKHLNEIMSILS